MVCNAMSKIAPTQNVSAEWRDDLCELKMPECPAR